MTDADADNDLLQRTHRGDGAAAAALWARHAPRLLATAALLTRGRESAAGAHDVVQQAFCRVLEMPSREVRAVRDAGAFLTTLTRRLALNARRGEGREQERRLRLAREDAGERQDPARVVPADLRAALDTLDADDRELIVLKHVACLTFDQMALALETGRSTVHARYRAAVERLRSALDAPATGPDVSGASPETHAGAARASAAQTSNGASARPELAHGAP